MNDERLGSKDPQTPEKRISSKQVAANRNNGKLGGPKTDVGKKTVAKNAIKHGLLAEAIVIDEYESQEEFDELFESLVDQINPIGPVEEMLVEKIAVSWWRLRRVALAEEGMIRVKHRDTERNFSTFAPKGSIQMFPGYRFRDMLPSEVDCKNLLRYETTFERQLYRALDQLDRIQRMRKGEIVPAPINVNINTEKE